MFKIAIDGPGGAGKSTIAKALAKTLGFIYIDTGAMYRAVALYCIRQGIDIQNDPDGVCAAIQSLQVDINYQDDGQHIYVNGEDVSGFIRTPEISMGASQVSAIGGVREKLVSLQRTLADARDVVMDGRDIGTKVLPDAQVKIFLTAKAEVRAKRRFDELVLKGNKDVSFDAVLQDMIQRDKNDSSRAISPLIPAEDSILLDTSGMDFDQALQAAKEIIAKKLENER